MGGARKKQPTAPPPQSQNVLNCLFSKRQVKLEKDADDDEPQEPPGAEQEAEVPRKATQGKPQEAEEPPKASLGP